MGSLPSQPGDIAASDTLLSLLLTAALLLHVSAALRRSRRRWRRLVLSATVRGTRIALVSTVLASIGVIASLPGLPTAGLAQTTPTDNQVSITSVGYVPSALTIGPGQTVHWTNNTTGTETVTSSDGLFGSGPIPPSGGFSIAVAEPGAHTYGSSNNSVLRGTITVSGLTGLAGAGTDLARAHIPDQAFPAPAEADISQHPIFGNMVSRTRILVTVAATATVDQVNTAFATAGVDLLGGLPRLGMVLVAAPDTLDLSGLSRALASLRASPAIGNAAMSPQIALDALPTGTIPPDWSWDVVNSSTGAPYGVNGNWNLKASRFPQAWNLLDAVNKKNAPVEVAVVDRGFQLGHPGLAKMVVNEDVCHPPTPPVPSAASTRSSRSSGSTVILSRASSRRPTLLCRWAASTPCQPLNLHVPARLRARRASCSTKPSSSST